MINISIGDLYKAKRKDYRNMAFLTFFMNISHISAIYRPNLPTPTN